jgi:hypothetical protein
MPINETLSSHIFLDSACDVWLLNVHYDQKTGRTVLRPVARISPVAAGIGALALAIAAPAISGETAITCTNPSSGVSFQIRIDYDRSTVDTNPAKIDDREISWRDENRWNYTLDRTSGNLTIILASSTGGSFLYDRCKLEH